MSGRHRARRLTRRLRRAEQRLARRGLKVTRRLSVRLLAVFFITSLIYGFGSFYAVRIVRETDYYREIVGAHIALHADLVLKEIGTPPDTAKARAIVERVPVDIRISGPGLDWRSDPRFPELAVIPFGPVSFLDLDERSLRELESWLRQVGVDPDPQQHGIADASRRLRSALGSVRGRNFIATLDRVGREHA